MSFLFMIVCGILSIYLVGKGAYMIHPGLFWMWIGYVCWKIADVLASKE